MAALIGPNAIWQHIPVLDAEIGEALRGALLARVGVTIPPEGSGMIAQDRAVHLHRAVRLYLPDRATRIQRAAGQGTAEYILAHRIPRLAQALIRALPAWAGARLLSGAIAKHAWTFVGSGTFRIVGHHPLTFEITGNPLAQGQDSTGPICDWHAAVFERLFQSLVWPQAQVIEDACIARGDPFCRFRILPASIY